MTAPDESRAKRRFLTLQALRLGGLTMGGTGAWLWRSAVDAGTEGIGGRLLVVAGLFVALVMPPLLARRWRREG
jgi:hypothetical protein